MLNWLRSEVENHVLVVFPGSIPPPLESLGGLRTLGIELRAVQPSGDDLWAATAEHPRWGTARLRCLRQPEIPSLLADFQTDLSETERHEIAQCRSAVTLVVRGSHRHILRDRKNAYRFAHALIGDGGVAALDELSFHFWSRDALEDELAHDADLSVSALISLHAVRSDSDDTVEWLHSHGLAEIGRFDFDLLLPSAAIMTNLPDLSASLASLILEERLAEDEKQAQIAYPGGVVDLVPAQRFMASAREEDLALRHDPDDSHLLRHSVFCEVQGRWSRLFGGRPRRSRWVEEADPDRAVFPFSTEATELMAARARATWHVFKATSEEFAALGAPSIVKVAYETDHGAPTDREHIWVEVDELRDDSFTGTVANEPFDVSSISLGHRDTVQLDRVTDWRMFTPLGSIHPNSLATAREVRRRWDEVLELSRQREK